MRRAPSIAVAVFAAALSAVPLAGCAPRAVPPAETATVSLPASDAASDAATTAAPLPDATLPEPGVLTDLLYRLADPAVPGAEKLILVQDATDADAGALDRFATALHDNGYRPPTFTAADIGWAVPAETVTANVTIAKDDTDESAVTLPMQFTHAGPQWQLDRDTFDLLLDTGPAR